MADQTIDGKLVVTDKVGIGVSDPIAQLHIVSFTAGPSQALLEAGGTQLKLTVSASGATIGTDNAFPLSIQTDQSPRISISSAGNVTIPGPLTVQNGLTASGNVSIGTDTTPATLEVKGNIQAKSATLTGALTVQTNLTVQGNLQVTGTTTFRNVEQHQGDLELGNEDTDQVKIHGVVLSSHSSKTLQISSPMKVIGTVTADQIGIGTTNPEATLHVVGKLLGAAQDTSGNALRICCGTTPEGRTAWQVYPGGAGIFVDVDTSMCRFRDTPIYIVNMHGNGYNWETTGGSSAYSRTATSFRVYVRFSGGKQLTPDFAISQGWHIEWVAVGN